MYGGSLIALFNPIEEIQISTELEQLKVNRTFKIILEAILKTFGILPCFVGQDIEMKI